jgi:hypothetical protein
MSIKIFLFTVKIFFIKTKYSAGKWMGEGCFRKAWWREGAACIGEFRHFQNGLSSRPATLQFKQS